MGHSFVGCGGHGFRENDILLYEAASLLVWACVRARAAGCTDSLVDEAERAWRIVLRDGWPGGHFMQYEELFVDAPSIDLGLRLHDDALTITGWFGAEFPADWMESIRRDAGAGGMRMYLAPVPTARVLDILSRLRALLLDARDTLD